LVDEAACWANSLVRDDDGSSSSLPLGFTANFYGARRSHVYLNNNGNVTFDAPLSNYTPFPLAAVNREIVAPFFADVDTRAARSGVVRYGYGSVVFEGLPAFCATWKKEPSQSPAPPRHSAHQQTHLHWSASPQPARRGYRSMARAIDSSGQ
jgi:hypothetical protein